MPPFLPDKRTALLITVAALGYFVDIYDLVLFNVVKRESLEFILGAGHPGIKDTGVALFNWQMAFRASGTVKTTWKYFTGKARCICRSTHCACREPWHFGQWRLRQLL